MDQCAAARPRSGFRRFSPVWPLDVSGRACSRLCGCCVWGVSAPSKSRVGLFQYQPDGHDDRIGGHGIGGARCMAAAMARVSPVCCSSCACQRLAVYGDQHQRTSPALAAAAGMGLAGIAGYLAGGRYRRGHGQ